MNVIKTMIVMAIVSLYAISWSMSVDQKIAKLKAERAELLNKIEKRAGGNSTMAYRAILKSNQPQLNDINEKIEILELVKPKL